MEPIFSKGVLDAALGANQMGRETWKNAVCQQEGVFSIAPGSAKCLLKPIDLTDAQKEPIKFQAELQRDFMGTPKGTVVPVKLNMLGRTDQCTVTIGMFGEMQLLLEMLTPEEFPERGH
jgi:hypothetical protein